MLGVAASVAHIITQSSAVMLMMACSTWLTFCLYTDAWSRLARKVPAGAGQSTLRGRISGQGEVHGYAWSSCI
jgi:hypothetical protein